MAKVLIVDDDPDFVAVTSAVLEANGHSVCSAADGDEGMRRLKEEDPDLIILDVIMKTVLDGLHMSRRVADDAQHRETPILMVTSIANSDYAALFPTDEYVRIDGFLSKPIPPEVLLSWVGRLTGASQAERSGQGVG